MTKALVLLSGGLDSLLAAKVLMEQGVLVTGLSFESYFFSTAKAEAAAETLGVKLIKVNFSQEHFAMVKNPKFGYGKNMNPCIDCHGLMLKKAGEIMDREKYDFVATGEVLGERPLSQNADALKIVSNVSGLKGKLVRPLSARLLPESDPEKTGLLKRSRLLDISGRSRKPQLALVKKYGIKEFSNPGGGCLLTDAAFSERLMKMIEYWPKCDGYDIALIKYGRLFWFMDKKGNRIIMTIGRHQADNENLLRFNKSGDILIDMGEAAGPTSVIRGIRQAKAQPKQLIIDVPVELKLSQLKIDEGKDEEEIIDLAARLTGYYAVKARGQKIKIYIKAI